MSSVDTRGHQLSERASRSLTRHFAQVMSLSANGRVWSWCFAVLEWVSEGRGGEEDVFTNVWGEAKRETVRTTRGSEKMMQSSVNWSLKPKLRPDSPRSFSWEMGSSEFATSSTKLKKRKPHKMSRKEIFLGNTHLFYLASAQLAASCYFCPRLLSRLIPGVRVTAAVNRLHTLPTVFKLASVFSPSLVSTNG